MKFATIRDHFPGLRPLSGEFLATRLSETIPGESRGRGDQCDGDDMDVMTTRRRIWHWVLSNPNIIKGANQMYR